MSIPYERTGRTAQKARTRRALVEAARELLAEGPTPTVEQVADTAAISRTTAYRYFPNQRALLLAVFPEIDTESLLPDDPPDDPEARLEALTEALTAILLQHEPELRMQLRLSLEPDGDGPPHHPYRTGRAITWIEQALAPLEGSLPTAALRRLVLAIRTAVGIEALVWLTDIAGLSRDEAAGLMRWSARALLRQALADHDERSG
ncbi:helix-turn-helix domain-containing protein [Isoptericola sp. F-RaC21]|uniref:TetR/AcrR family transcriptional regulator n=1 Tax=Isoptericola sp. F-RaC21 TaxID=3141452 RepID=UPI00315B6A3F